MACVNCNWLPKYEIECTPTKRGGISKFIFMKKRYIAGEVPLDLCSLPVVDLQDLEEWDSVIENCYVRITPELLADKPATTFEALDNPFNCQVDLSGSGQKVINFKIYSYDENESDIDFWNCLLNEPHKYRFAYVTCENEVYGFFNFSLEVSQIIEETKNGTSYKEGSLKYAGLRMDKKLNIPDAVLVALENFRQTECNIIT